MVCFRYIIINTLHKGDKKDDDDDDNNNKATVFTAIYHAVDGTLKIITKAINFILSEKNPLEGKNPE